MAERRGEEEVFGEDFNLLEDIEDIIINNSQEKESPKEEDDDEKIELPEEGSGTEEEDEEKGNKEISEEDTEQPANTDTSSSPLIPYAKYLKEEGILPNFDLEKFDGSIDSLRDGMFNEILSGVEQYKATLPEPVKALLNNYEEGVPLETLLKIDAEKAKYTSITQEQLESEDVQKSLIREYLTKTTKFSKEKIEKEISRLADLQELEDEAKGVLPELIAIQQEAEQGAVEEAKKQKELAEQSRLQELESLRSTLETTDEVIPGIKLSDAMRQKVFKNLTTPVGYNELGQPVNKLGAYRIKNPVQTEVILNYIYELTNEFKDWTVFNKGAKRAVISEIEKAARNLDNNTNNGRSATFSKQGAPKDLIREIDDFLNT